MDKILMLLPTRGRPAKAWDAVASFHATSAGRAQLLLLLDEDDPERDTYRVTLAKELLSVGQRVGMCASLNRAVHDFPDYAYYGFFGDDHRFCTPDWDRIAIETIEGKGNGWGVFYGDDLLQGQKLPTAVVLSGTIVKTLGWMCLPGLRHMYADNVWKTLGESIDRLFYDPKVVIEHMHFSNGKSVLDDQYRQVNNPAVYQADAAVYEHWYQTQREEDAHRLRVAMA